MHADRGREDAEVSIIIKSLTPEYDTVYLRGVLMNNKEELYESLIRLGLLLIFMFSLVAGTVGLLSICRTLIDSDRPRFMNSYRHVMVTAGRPLD
jgi:hypothetical protein